MLRRILVVLSVLAALVVFVGFFGGMIRAADSLALLRPVAGAACLVGLLLVRDWASRFVLAAAVGLTLATVVPPFLPGQTPGAFAVYSKNLHVLNVDVDEIVQDIFEAEVDVVFLQEVSPRNVHILAALAEVYPHQLYCPVENWLSVAIASRRPIEGEGHCGRHGLAIALIDVDGQSVWVASVHLLWPWPVQSGWQETEVIDTLAALDGPVVMAGDFNAFPWNWRVRAVAGAVDGVRAGPTQRTFRFQGLPLPIDHAFAPGGGTLEVRPLFSADHHGIVARLHLTPP